MLSKQAQQFSNICKGNPLSTIERAVKMQSLKIREELYAFHNVSDPHSLAVKLSLCLFTLIALLCLSSCDQRTDKKEFEGDTRYTYIKELSVRGESHEYIIYSPFTTDGPTIGMAHYPECVFCAIKRDSLNKSPVLQQ